MIGAYFGLQWIKARVAGPARMTEELWMEVHNIVQDVVNKTIPKKKKEMQDSKVVV